MKPKGYTLIEILVVLSIVGLIFAASFASFREFSRRQAMLSAARNLKSDIKLVQEQAIAGKKPQGCDELTHYALAFTASSYEITAECVNGSYAVKEVAMPVDVTISSLPVPNPITFKTIAQGTNVNPAAPAAIILTHTKISMSLSITVTSGGKVE